MRYSGDNNRKYPCMGCTERYPACHDSCERYAEAKRIADEAKVRRDEFGDYLIDKHRRLKRWSKKGY